MAALHSRAFRNPWPLASLIAIAIACLTDLIAAPGWPRPAALALLAGLAVFLGLVQGALWALAFALFARLPKPLRIAIWPLAGAATGVWLGYLLGSFTRLTSRYWQLAAGVLGGAVIAGVALGAIVALYQPRRQEPPWLFTRRLWLRAIAALVLLAIAAGAWYVDRRFYPGQYYYGHVALRLVVVWTTMLALMAAVAGKLPMRSWIWSAAVGALAACVFTPNVQRLMPALASRPWPALLLKVSQKLSDFDRDGYSAILGGGDCAPWNPRVHPGAREVPGNGIDDNCMLGDARRKTAVITSLPTPAMPSPVDVVLITVDSLRPDRMGLYNNAQFGPNGRATTPNLDRFAREATVFDRAYSAGAWTSVAVPSILRGVYPRRLEWRKWFETTQYALVRKPFKLRQDERFMRMFPLAFDDKHPPIASMLRNRGMYTAAVTDDGHSEMLQSGTGLEEGFVSFREVDNAPPDRRNDAGTADLAISSLARIPPSKRFFLWVHFFGIHWPDEFHQGVRVFGQTQADHYDHEVAFFDQQVGRLLDALAARKHPSAVIVAADHGESLAAGIRQHGLTLEEAVIKIPLIVRAPGWPARHIAAPASSLDLVPTILALTGTPMPGYLDGVNVKELVDAKVDKPRVLFSDTWRYDSLERLEINYSAAFDGSHKVIMDRMTGGVWEFDQEKDDRLLDGRNAAYSSLSRALLGYLEEAGGALDLSE